jgi:hypothetical protein
LLHDGGVQLVVLLLPLTQLWAGTVAPAAGLRSLAGKAGWPFELVGLGRRATCVASPTWPLTWGRSCRGGGVLGELRRRATTAARSAVVPGAWRPAARPGGLGVSEGG